MAVNKVTHTSEGKAVEKVSSSGVSSISSSIDSERASSSELVMTRIRVQAQIKSVQLQRRMMRRQQAQQIRPQAVLKTIRHKMIVKHKSSATRQSSSSSAKLTKLNVESTKQDGVQNNTQPNDNNTTQDNNAQ